MNPLKVMLVLGTRPEAIKLAPVIRAMRAEPGIHVDVILSGQHRDLVASILDFFQVQATRDLEIMVANQTLAALTSRAMNALDAVMAELRPDWVVVQGDTTTAMTAALCAFYRGIQVAHLEAGLRTNQRNSPFPEEINRRYIGQVASLNWAPTRRAASALEREGLPLSPGRVLVTGNTVIDALLDAVARVRQTPVNDVTVALVQQRRQLVSKAPVVLITGHRRENFGEPFRDFCQAIRIVAERHPEATLVYPVHPNPNVRAPVHAILGGIDNLVLTEPKDYPAFVALLDLCDIVLTDSGGVQEEAPALGKPVLVTRHDTERPEGIGSGHVKLIGPRHDAIVSELGSLLAAHRDGRLNFSPALPYGDGRASERCTASLLGRAVVEFQG